MTYSELIQKLYQVSLFNGVKLGLKNMERLQEHFKFPDRAFQTIHIAGTNGKGSTAIKIATALQASGKKAGLYTSPHISCFRERIRINSEMITEKAIEEILPNIFEVIEKEKISATFFEITTLLAFLYFAQEKVEIAVIETGLGGRLDATNCITPLLSIITSIDLDHTEILGTTKEQITAEKAGVIKPNVPVLIGPHVPLDLIKREAEKKNSPVLQVNRTSFSFEEENNLIASSALTILSHLLPISGEAIQKGLAAKQPCRFEIFDREIPIILDVAHNPNGLARLFTLVKTQYPNRPIRVLFGLSKNKDLQGSVKVIQQYGCGFHLVEATNGRGTAVEVLRDGLLALGVQSSRIHVGKIDQNFKQAREIATEKNEILVVCGTFFIMRDIREALGLQEPQDPLDTNEKL